MTDVLGPALRVLFVGFNPSLRSAETGTHYAGRGNQFWRLLADAALTTRLLTPAEDRSMLAWGLGSSNLVARPTITAAELSRSEMRAGLPRLRRVLRESRPAVVAYTGKGVYLAASGLPRTEWGLQPESLFSGPLDFVLPSPSGLVRMRPEEKLRWYRELRLLLDRIAPLEP